MTYVFLLFSFYFSLIVNILMDRDLCWEPPEKLKSPSVRHLRTTNCTWSSMELQQWTILRNVWSWVLTIKNFIQIWWFLRWFQLSTSIVTRMYVTTIQPSYPSKNWIIPQPFVNAYNVHTIHHGWAPARTMPLLK